MDLAIGRGASDRKRGSFPPWRQENMLLEETKTDPSGYNILSRPPLATVYTWGSGPVHGIFQRDGLFNGDTFAIIGDTLYREGSALGAIDGTGPVWWAGGFDEIALGRGQSAYSYNGTDLAAIAFPDGADVRSGHWKSRLFYFLRKGSGRFYWSAIDDARTIDGLNFANAESEPDDLYDIKSTGDVFWMLGSATGEAWVETGDPDLPLSKVSQRNLTCGVRDTGCAEEIEGTVYFISNDGMVRRITSVAERVSDNSLEEKIRQSATASTFLFQYEGKPVLCLRLDSGTYGLDLALGHQPLVFSTMGRTQWAPKCAVNVGAEPLFGDDTDGLIYQFDDSSATDSGQSEFRRVFSAGAPIGQATPFFNVVVQGNNGSAQTETGESADPILEMRYSRDAGRTWSDWRASRWGRMGEYNRRARFGSCGTFSPPGFLAEFRMLACAPLRVERAGYNESLVGRGR